MKKLLNTLFITTQGVWLARERENILIRKDQETIFRLPIHNLGSIVCFGQVSASAPLMGLCAERRVSLSFLTEYGRFLARIEGPVRGNVLLRRAQHRASDNPLQALALARTIVSAKIANSRFVLQRVARDRDEVTRDKLKSAINKLNVLLRQARTPGSDLDSYRGYEGRAARIYFDTFNLLVLSPDPAFVFTGRSRRPPLDPVNAMLSFVYTLLRNDIQSALETVGLDPAMGFLHRDRPGRPALALDVMEEFRAPLADRFVLSLINRKQVDSKGFRKTESGAIEMTNETRKILLNAWQTRKREKVMHPYLNESLEIGLLPFVQARLLANYLRGDLESYPPVIWR
jgi:CRISPR-associated protein Cas1